MKPNEKRSRKRKFLLKLVPDSPAQELLGYLGDKGAESSFIAIKKPAYFSEIKFKNAIRKLRKEKLFLEEGGKIKLSDDGLVEYAAVKVKRSDPLPEGIDCIVVFDIPEKERKTRMFLTALLIDLAFIRLQKSVWISQFDNAKDLDILLKKLKIRKWVRIFNGKEQ